jgi:hypothetical protein
VPEAEGETVSVENEATPVGSAKEKKNVDVAVKRPRREQKRRKFEMFDMEVRSSDSEDENDLIPARNGRNQNPIIAGAIASKFETEAYEALQQMLNIKKEGEETEGREDGEEELKMEEPEEPVKKLKVRRRRCREKGCEKWPQSGGLCTSHGGGRPCTVKGCKTPAQSKGLCKKHGGGTEKECSIEGCTTRSVSKGLCWKHGGGTTKLCKIKGCLTLVHNIGLCFKHGGGIKCIVEGCQTLAHCRRRCWAHGGRPLPKKK